MFPVSRYKPISNSQVIILSLNFLFFFTTTSGQQRGLDGSQNVQVCMKTNFNLNVKVWSQNNL